MSSDSLGPPLDKLSTPPMLKRQVTKGSEIGDDDGHFSVQPVNVLMIGTGEYTTGYVNGAESASDKGAGVVALTMIDMKSKKKTDRLALCGVNGKKYPGIRQHMHNAIGKYDGLDRYIDDIGTFPEDNVVDPKAYEGAIASFDAGDAAIIFTPDDTHFDIALACIRKGMHVCVTKPAVKTLREHQILYEEAVKHNVLCCIEVHKRWDQIYVDARDKIDALGPFSLLHAYMSQPKHQLETFKAWAGKSSDISYYLNSHHIDFHEWCVGDSSRPVKVVGTASTGVATSKFGIDSEDTITLTVEWENISPKESGNGVDVQCTGTAIYTSSWIAPKSDVHSQQRFFYMGHKGEVNVDQAHRGYTMADDASGFRNVNPLFMKYTPTDGKFSGQLGYGYRSFEAFIDAVQDINAAHKTVADFDHSLASLATTFRTTAILEAGRRSLDEGRAIQIVYEDAADPVRPTNLK